MRRLGFFMVVLVVSLADGAFIGRVWSVEPYNMRLLGQVGGLCRGIAAEGPIVYAGQGRVLAVFDATQPDAPHAIGRIILSDLIEDVAKIGNLVYVAVGDSGLEIVDVSDPTSPWVLGACAQFQSAADVAVDGPLAAVACGTKGLKIVDVGDPTSPTLVGSYVTTGSLVAVRLVGNLAYVADADQGLMIVDISTPSSPQRRGVFSMNNGAGAVEVTTGTAYVSERAGTRLFILDVSSPTSPVTQGVYSSLIAGRDMEATGTLLYAAGLQALAVIDVSRPSTPTMLASHLLTDLPNALDVQGNVAYVGKEYSGFEMAEYIGAGDIRKRRGWHVPGMVQSVGGGGDEIVWVTGQVSGLFSLDLEDPHWPVPIGFMPLAPIDYVWSMRFVDRLAYMACDSDGLAIVDVSMPTTPTLLGQFSQSFLTQDLAMEGRIAYLADGNNGLRVIDTTRPQEMGILATVDTSGTAKAVAVVRDRVYVADFGHGLLVFDVSDPYQPRLIGRDEATPQVYDLAAVGTKVYLVGWYATEASMWIVEASDPAAIRRLGAVALDQFPTDILVRGNRAYVTSLEGGLWVVDIEKPWEPRIVGRYLIGEELYGTAYEHGAVCVAGHRSGVWVFQFLGDAPRITHAAISDRDDNGSIGAGDQLVLVLDRSVEVTTQVLQAGHFFLPVEGDSLGGAGFAIHTNPYNSRQIVLTLGQGVNLRASGEFSTTTVGAGSPSAIDFATTLPFGAIVSVDGVSAIDGGAPDLNDTGVDVRLSMVGRQGAVGTGGGQIGVVPSPDALYTRHRLTVPAGSLVTTTTFRLRSPQESLGAINVFQIEPSTATVTFSPPATVRVQYREGDIDRERGLVEGEMRVQQLVQDIKGDLRYVPVRGTLLPQIPASKGEAEGGAAAEAAVGEVSVQVSDLNPEGSLGTIGIFAGLPVETVDERSISIRPSPPPGAMAGEQTGALLQPGPEGAYQLHQLEFVGYQLTTSSDTSRTVVTIRTATLAERVSQTGGQSFPSRSGAVFVVTATNALGQPVAFTDPVHVTVQFKARDDPFLSDVVRFDGYPTHARNMRLAHDQLSGATVDFDFVAQTPHVVNESVGTVRVDNVVDLTGPDGKGTFGAVAHEYYSPARRWELYR